MPSAASIWASPYFYQQHNLSCIAIWWEHPLCSPSNIYLHIWLLHLPTLKRAIQTLIDAPKIATIAHLLPAQEGFQQHAAVHLCTKESLPSLLIPSPYLQSRKWKLAVMSRGFRLQTAMRRRRVLFLPHSSVMQPKWVFLTAHSVKLSGEFRLVLSRWLHPRLDYSLGFKPGPILGDAVWHFGLAYKRLPYIGPALLSLCLPQHWPPARQ